MKQQTIKPKKLVIITEFGEVIFTKGKDLIYEKLDPKNNGTGIIFKHWKDNAVGVRLPQAFHADKFKDLLRMLRVEIDKFLKD
jgi:hypothetical protein